MYNITNTRMDNNFEYIEGIEIDDNLLYKTVFEIRSDGLLSTWKIAERKSFNLDNQYNIESSVYDQFEVQPNLITTLSNQIRINGMPVRHQDNGTWERDKVPNIFLSFRYQVIRKGIPKHIDAQRKSILNYIINTGGDNVITKWYDSNDNVIEQVIVQEKKWYRMKTDINHTIEGMTSDRLMLTVSLI